MPWLSDRLLQRLQSVADAPDLSATKYRLLERIAAGGMGTIYLAEDTQLQRRVALKVLHTHVSARELAERMWREARIIAQLEHPGIVPVHDVGELPDGRVFYAMKLVQGQRLDQYLQQTQALPERLRLFQKICEAVAFAHARAVLHRDLKPENVMVGAFGEVLVMDWGLAKVFAHNAEEERSNIADRASASVAQSASDEPPAPSNLHSTQHGTILGTPAYMSPEQQRGEIDQLDERTDVYALGAILAFLLDCKDAEPEPEQRAHSASPRAHMPKQLRAICAKAMASEKSSRYASVQALAADVERFLNGLTVSSYQENFFETLLRTLKKFQFLILLVLVYLLVRVLLFFWLRP